MAACIAVYGDTPPAVVAIDGSLLGDCAVLRQVAEGIAAQWRRRPAWILGQPPECLPRTGARLGSRAESLLFSPREPPAFSDRWEATAWVLQEHLAGIGLRVPVADRAEAATIPRRPCAVVAGRRDRGPLADAAELAHDLGVRKVALWSRGVGPFLETAQWQRARDLGVEVEISEPPAAAPIRLGP